MLSVVVTAANVANVTQVDKLLHGEENVVCADDDSVRSVESVDGAPTFTNECRGGSSVMWEIAAARCSQRLKRQNE